MPAMIVAPTEVCSTILPTFCPAAPNKGAIVEGWGRSILGKCGRGLNISGVSRWRVSVDYQWLACAARNYFLSILVSEGSVLNL